MSELRLRRRTRLKTKPSKQLRARLEEVFPGTALWQDRAVVETADWGGMDVVLVDGVVHALVDDGDPFLSVRGLLAYGPSSRWVTVDMGAVRFVHNGADVMAPGIVGADPVLQEGEWCWIRDEKNHRPLAIGRCLMAGSAMAGATAGKAVRSVHHLGDRLWELDS